MLLLLVTYDTHFINITVNFPGGIWVKITYTLANAVYIIMCYLCKVHKVNA
jgi:hypothetical protein